MSLDADPRLEQAKRLAGDLEAGQHAVGLHQEHSAGLHPRRHGGVGGDVAVAHIFVERAADNLAIERGI